MSFGLTSKSHTPIFDPTSPPWMNLKAEEWKSNMRDQADDILQHWNAYCWQGSEIPNIPHLKAWGIEQAMKLVEGHPITWEANGASTAEDDVMFVCDEIASWKKVLEIAARSRAEEEVLHGKWVGKIPNTHLIHALIDDDSIKKAFLH